MIRDMYQGLLEELLAVSFDSLDEGEYKKLRSNKGSKVADYIHQEEEAKIELLIIVEKKEVENLVDTSDFQNLSKKDQRIKTNKRMVNNDFCEGVHIQYANYADKIGKGIKIANKQIKSTIELLELKPENTVKIIVFNVKDGIFRNSSPHWTIDNANTKEKDHGLYSKYDFQQLSKCQDCIFFLSEYSENKRLGLNYILPNLESKHYQDFILPRLLDNKCKDIERCKNECLKIATKRKDGIWDITGSSLNETS